MVKEHPNETLDHLSENPLHFSHITDKKHSAHPFYPGEETRQKLTDRGSLDLHTHSPQEPPPSQLSSQGHGDVTSDPTPDLSTETLQMLHH